MTNSTPAQAMKRGMRRLAAGVSVISLTGTDARSYAMTVTSVASVSDTPPSLLVCINRATRLHGHLRVGGSFAINVLSRDHETVSVACSSGEQAETRFKVGDWTLSGQAPAPPVLRGAEAVFTCIARELHPYGTHTVVIGDIESVVVAPAAPRPLVYLDGRYLSLPDA